MLTSMRALALFPTNCEWTPLSNASNYQNIEII